MEANTATLLTIVGNTTVEAAGAYITQPAATLGQIRAVPYDQYEVSIPVDKMGSCIRRLMGSVYDGDMDGDDAVKGYAAPCCVRGRVCACWLTIFGI